MVHPTRLLPDFNARGSRQIEDAAELDDNADDFEVKQFNSERVEGYSSGKVVARSEWDREIASAKRGFAPAFEPDIPALRPRFARELKRDFGSSDLDLT